MGTSKSKYEQAYDGDWIQPIMKKYKMRCCDCGLVHTVDFRIVGKRVQLSASRDKRATAASRNWLKKIKNGNNNTASRHIHSD